MEEDYSQNQNYGNNNYNQEPSDSFLKEMIDVEPTMQKFEFETLRRKRLHIDIKNKTKKWVPMAEGVNPVMNELGISELLGMLRGRCTIIARLTKKTDDEVLRDMHQFHRALIELFELRADDWELDEELCKPLLETCVDLVQDIVFSSRGGFTAMNMRTQYSKHDQTSSQTNGDDNVKSILGMKIR